MKMKTIKQLGLSSECFSVQIWGLEHCKTCEYRDTDECGGKNIRDTKKNENGKNIPLNG